MFTKEQIKQKLDEAIDKKIIEKHAVIRTNIFENDAQITSQQNKIDSLRKDVADLNIRRRSSDDESYKKSIDLNIDSKRNQIRTIQKNLKSARIASLKNTSLDKD